MSPTWLGSSTGASSTGATTGLAGKFKLFLEKIFGNYCCFNLTFIICFQTRPDRSGFLAGGSLREEEEVDLLLPISHIKRKEQNWANNSKNARRKRGARVPERGSRKFCMKRKNEEKRKKPSIEKRNTVLLFTTTRLFQI